MITDKDKILICKTYLLENNTIRSTAKIHKISKSTVHTILSEISNIDYDLFLKIKNKVEFNTIQRSISGGEATKLKWKMRKKINED